MNKNSAHPTSALKDKDWVLCNAIEFHYINNSFSGGNNTLMLSDIVFLGPFLILMMHRHRKYKL